MAHADRTRRVFLIGFMGAGKTSVGRALARRLGWVFCDLDDLIEEREGNSIAAIFAEQGEAAFRQAESAALKVLLEERVQGDRIVALGGGAFVQAQNREALEQSGAITVLLDAPLQELRRRCREDEGSRVRPLAQQEDRFTELFIARRPAYERARHRVETMGKTVEEVAAEIECILAAASPEVKK
ncbi:MAG TPA: shikimate kinase [Terriglobales bacterium]|nr:shikimate kinase [Terriglobales bacterium]